jgi:20S proteasome subunit beta 7
VLGIKFKDGVMLAADCLGAFARISVSFFLSLLCDSTASYGSLARFKDVQRLHPVGNNTVVAASGDMSDFQHIQQMLESLMIDEFNAQDGHPLGPAEIHEYLSQVMYARRSKMNPLWNSMIVGGVKDGVK